MPALYPVQTPQQLAAYLRALRKAQGMTQRELGQQLGVSVARVSTIEQNPGAVSLQQMLRVLHALGAQLSLSDTPTSTPKPGLPDLAERSDGDW